MGVPVLGVTNDQSSRKALLILVSKRLWILTVVLSFAGAAVGYLTGGYFPQSQSVSATVLVAPLEGNPFYPSSRGEQLVNLTTEAVVLKSDAVAQLVLKQTNSSETTAVLLKGLSTNVPPNTQLIEISYEHRDAAVAIQRAQSFADSFLEFRSNRAKTYLDGQIAGIQTETKNLADRMEVLAKQLKVVGTNAVQKTVLEARLSAGAGQIAALGARESSLATTRIDPGQVITPAGPDRAPLIGTKEILGLFGLLTGIAAAAAIVLFSARGRRVVKRRSELEVYRDSCALLVPTAMPTLVPTAMPTSRFASVPTSSGASQSADYIKFRSQLLALFQGGNKRVFLLVTSGQSSTGHLSTAVVAEALVASKIQSIFIDTTGELDIPGTPLPGAPGLGEALQDTSSLSDFITTDGPFLKIMGPGNFSSRHDTGIPTHRFNELLSETTRMVDVVIVIANDLSQPLTQSLVASIPTVLMEVQVSVTRHTDIRVAQSTCSSLAAELIGLLVVTPDAKHSSQSRSVGPAKNSIPIEESDINNGITHAENS